MKNKIIALLFIVFSLFFIGGCKKASFDDPKTYQITYIVMGEISYSDIYQEGIGKELYTYYSDTYKESFSGWYDNRECSGTVYTHISKTDSGDKTFYGMFYELNDELVNLENALSINNYTYEFIEKYGNTEYVDTYLVDDGVIMNTYQDFDITYNDYLDLTGAQNKIIYLEDDVWYYTLEGERMYNEYYDYMIILNLLSLNSEHFTYNRLNQTTVIFNLEEEYLQDEIDNFMGLYETEDIVSCEISLVNNTLSSIKIVSSYESFCDTVYEINFSNIGTTIVNLPDPIIKKEEVNELTPLEEATYDFELTRGLPSIGDVNVLVIPVEFNDWPAPASMKLDLETVFFGTSEETGWESLKSYYYKSSYGKLNICGTVLEPFSTGVLSSKYSYDNQADYKILKAALEYYDPYINYNDYDSDGDGYIDAIYLVYTRDYDVKSNVWWAYTYEYLTSDYEYYDSVEADYYVFMSYQFIFDELCETKVKYNAETIIHETGHLLGLDDYYDYSPGVGPDGGIGGGDMMDNNVGDHNAYSKVLLGWITPIIITESCVIDLESFEETGECIMICKNYNGTYFDEYFIIDFFTPTGINEVGKDYNGLFGISGIRILHINATLNTKELASETWTITLYNNSDSTNKLISLIEADGNNDILSGELSENDDLFQVNDVYDNAIWHDGTNASFILEILSLTKDYATIQITI